MPIPDRTVDPDANGVPDVFESIETEAAREKMTDQDIWAAWQFGLSCYKALIKINAEFVHDRIPGPVRSARCNCENSHCNHTEAHCRRPAGVGRIQDVGAVCDECYCNYPVEYRLLNTELRKA